MEGEVAFFADPQDATSSTPNGTYATIQQSMGMIILDCKNGALLREHAEEAFGKLPIGTPKPLPPVFGFSSSSKTDNLPSCATTESIEAAYTLFTSSGPGQLPAYFQALASLNYQERLFQWKLSQIENSGQFSEEQMLDFAMRLIDKTVENTLMRGLDNLMKMMELADSAANAEARGDKAAMCRDTVSLLKEAATLNASAAVMWAGQHRKIDAEAAKLGITY